MRDVPPQAVELIKNEEGCRLTPYRDVTGALTVGWGHKILPHESWPIPVSQEDVDAQLDDDIGNTAAGLYDVLGATADTLGDNQWAALLDFGYNLGVGAFAGSTLCEFIKAGNLAKAEGEFGRWIYATVNGRRTVVQGLVKRRAAEAKLWAMDLPSAGQPSSSSADQA